MTSTPGPWRIDNRKWEEGARGHVVCEVMTCFGGHTVRAEPDHCACPARDELDRIGKANALLIAAAPDLLDAAKRALDIINSYNHIPAQFMARDTTNRHCQSRRGCVATLQP